MPSFETFNILEILTRALHPCPLSYVSVYVELVSRISFYGYCTMFFFILDLVNSEWCLVFFIFASAGCEF